MHPNIWLQMDSWRTLAQALSASHPCTNANTIKKSHKFAKLHTDDCRITFVRES
jgi:hypothetical protein